MKYIDSEKLIAEIERLAKSYKDPTFVTVRGNTANNFRDNLLSFIASLQQEQPDTKEQSSHLEHWLAFFGCPEENIEKCATQISQGYGAIRYPEGVQHGAEAVNELAQQEEPEVDLEKFDKEVTKIWGKCAADPDDSLACFHIETFNEIARHFYGLRNRALEEAARHVYESWMGGTMVDVRLDMVELGKVLNAREK